MDGGLLRASSFSLMLGMHQACSCLGGPSNNRFQIFVPYTQLCKPTFEVLFIHSRLGCPPSLFMLGIRQIPLVHARDAPSLTDRERAPPRSLRNQWPLEKANDRTRAGGGSGKLTTHIGRGEYPTRMRAESDARQQLSRWKLHQRCARF